MSKVKSVTMELPKNTLEVQIKYAKIIVEVLYNKLSYKEIDKLINLYKKSSRRNQNNNKVSK